MLVLHNQYLIDLISSHNVANSESKVSREDESIFLIAEDNYKIDQVQQIFRTHLVKRGLSSGYFEFSKIEDARGGLLKQFSKILQGIDKELAQQINKTIKNTKLKVQVSIRGDELRVSSNKRDLLQSTIQIIKEMKVKQPLQFINFRD